LGLVHELVDRRRDVAPAQPGRVIAVPVEEDVRPGLGGGRGADLGVDVAALLRQRHLDVRVRLLEGCHHLLGPRLAAGARGGGVRGVVLARVGRGRPAGRRGGCRGGGGRGRAGRGRGGGGRRRGGAGRRGRRRRRGRGGRCRRRRRRRRGRRRRRRGGRG